MQLWPLMTAQRLFRLQTKSRPNLFIFDTMMPQPDGYRLCGLIRANPIYQHTPILIITALDYSNSKAASFGADDYLTKPFDLDES